jgi:mRNA interferase MazF
VRNCSLDAGRLSTRRWCGGLSGRDGNKAGGRVLAGVVEPLGSEPSYDRPYVIVQNNALNSSRINTVIVCGLTSNLRRAGDPGNMLLSPGEADLSEQSVVNVSQVVTVDKSQLRTRIGALSP